MRVIPDAIVRSEIVEINAPNTLIWEILTDLPRYPEWNPFCVECESTLEMGAPVKMKLKDYVTPGNFFDNCEFVCAFDPPKLLSWQLPYSDEWPYPARRDQIIERISDTISTYQSTDAFLGDNGIHVMRFAGPWVKRAFDDTAHALKARAEKMAKERS
ncbi:MAG: SRPBCC domain-containing protein [Pseudomonadota bacterium]